MEQNEKIWIKIAQDDSTTNKLLVHLFKAQTGKDHTGHIFSIQSKNSFISDCVFCRGIKCETCNIATHVFYDNNFLRNIYFAIGEKYEYAPRNEFEALFGYDIHSTNKKYKKEFDMFDAGIVGLILGVLSWIICLIFQ